MLNQGSPNNSPKSSFADLKDPLEQKVIDLMLANKNKELLIFLNEHLELDLTNIHDNLQDTILHIACLNNQAENLKAFLTHAKKIFPSEKVIEWINEPNFEKITALHYSAMNGNLEIFKYLEAEGANLSLTTDKGLNVSHIAAQADQPLILAYYRSKGFDLNTPDSKGCTPLHWASFCGKENSVTFLLAWGLDPNKTENENKWTPLHFAVHSGNRRIVKKLLIKKADRKVKDSSNQTPLDIAIDNDLTDIADVLRGRNWIMDCLNIKPDLQKKRTKKTLIWFLFLFSIMCSGNILFLFPFLTNLFWMYFFMISSFLLFVTFMLAWKTNPGKMRNRKKEWLFRLLLENQPDSICADCAIVKPPRSKHCELCNACIKVYDHHCPWINNCVGAKNHKYFLGFIFFTMTSLAVMLLISIEGLETDTATQIFIPSLLQNQAEMISCKTTICIMNLVLSGPFLIPLVLLNLIHFGNFFQGRTTLERFGQGDKRISDIDQAPGNINLNHESLSSNADYHSLDENSNQTRTSETHYFGNCLDMCFRNSRNQKYSFSRNYENYNQQAS